ncbi:MAG: phosphoadenosine phosphosulfate reductase family protein [Waterburya sp.]
MPAKQLNLFDNIRMPSTEALELTNEYLKNYFQKYRHVGIAFSGGKDSTALVSVVIHAIERGIIPRPESLTVVYADTRLELPPLYEGAMAVLEDVRRRGFNTKIAVASMDKRLLPYILGRGVPPPNNNTLRYCTRAIKVEPMMAAMADLRANLTNGERLLMLTEDFAITTRD